MATALNPTPSLSPFSLDQLEGFPYADYSRKLAACAELESWFVGTALDEFISIGKNKIAKYPIKINPIYNAVLKHASALFGEFPEHTDGPLVRPRVRNLDKTTSERTEHIEDVLDLIWSESNGAALQMEAGIISQIYGGFALRAAYNPLSIDTSTGFWIELIKPYEFVARPRAGNFWNLSEAWLVRKISAQDALEYGVTIGSSEGYYVEHWDPYSYWVKINDAPVSVMVGNFQYVASGANPFGVVPFVYIPHMRWGKFDGDTLIRESVKGVVREMNARTADLGDAVSDDTHVYAVMKNVRGRPEIMEIDGIKIINLGSVQNITGNEKEPSLEFPSKTKLTDSALTLTGSLYGEFRRQTDIPAVADGEDEGSQRSSATLTARMGPLVSHARQERTFWNSGLRAFHRILLRMLMVHGAAGITPDDAFKTRLSSRWYSVIPRDRESLINELSVRAAGHLGSLEHLLDLTGDVENPAQEMKLIIEWLKTLATATKPPEPKAQEGEGESDKKPNESKKNEKE